MHDCHLQKVLAEILRTMAAADFPARWPELLPTLAQAFAHASVPTGHSDATAPTAAPEEPSTPNASNRGAPVAAKNLPLEQVLMVVATVSKQFVWFRDTSHDKPANAAASGKEQSTAPEELDEFVGKEWNRSVCRMDFFQRFVTGLHLFPVSSPLFALLLFVVSSLSEMLFPAKLFLPLINDTLPQLVQFLATTTMADSGGADNDASRAQLCCYLLAKALHRCTRVYMPLQLGTAIAAAPPQGFLPNLLQLLEVRK